jgi:hypothetical protein
MTYREMRESPTQMNVKSILVSIAPQDDRRRPDLRQNTVDASGKDERTVRESSRGRGSSKGSKTSQTEPTRKQKSESSPNDGRQSRHETRLRASQALGRRGIRVRSRSRRKCVTTRPVEGKEGRRRCEERARRKSRGKHRRMRAESQREARVTGAALVEC